MEKKDNNLFSLIKTFLRLLFQSFDSIIGRINLTTSFFILIIILASILVPTAVYLLLGLKMILDTLLIIFEKSTLTYEINAAPPSAWMVTGWIALLSFETWICSLLVQKWEAFKMRTLNRREKNKAQQKKQ